MEIEVDTTAPLALEIDNAAIEEIEGDHVVNLAESPDVTISGDGVEPTSTVEVTITDSLLGTIGPITATVNPDGTWTIPDQDFTGLEDGPITVTAVETDEAGNVGPDVITILTLDTTPPAQPPVADMTSPTDSAGTSNSDDLTNQTSPTFDAPPGTGVAGDTVTLYIDGSPVATGTVNSDGSYELTPTAPLAEGPHAVTVSFTDPAGNEGPHSEVLPIVIDTIAPAELAIDNADTAEIEEDHVINLAEVTDVTISGDGVEPTSTVEVTITDSLLGTIGPITTTVNPDGTWSIPDQDLSSLEDGPITVSTVETDAAGNVGEPVATVLEKDTVAPPAAVISPNLTDETDSAGTSNADDITNVNTPTFDAPAGTGEPDAIVTLYADGTPVGTATVNPDGSYTVSVDEESPLADGPHAVTVTFTDPAGNESAASPILEIEVDTTAPLALEIDNAAVEEIEGDHVVNLAESPDVTISGDGVEPTSTVEVTMTDSALNTIGPITATVNPDGTWTIPDQDFTGLEDGPITVTAVETDEAGNVGPDVITILTLDTTPPEPPEIPNLTDPTDSGALNTDNITNDNTPNFDAPAGTGSYGDAVTFYAVPLDEQGTPTGTAVVIAVGTVNEDGSYEVNVPAEMADGDYSITATFTDPAGNESDESTALVVTIDTTPPELPNINSPIEIDDVINLVESTDVLTEGTAEPNSEVHVTFDDGNLLTAPITVVVSVDENGDWTLTGNEADLTALEDGPISLSVTATDVAGNTSEPAEIAIEMDTTPPLDPAIAPNLTDETDSAGTSNEDDITNVNTPTFDAPAGTGESNAIVTLYVDGIPVGTATVNPDGSYTVSVDEESPIADGPHDVTVTFTDPAGNESGFSPELVIVVDTTAPKELAIDAPIELDNIVNLAESPTVEITGSDVEPTSTVVVTFTDSLLSTIGPITATVNPDGTWAIDPTDLSSFEDGEITVTAIETDAAGNVGEPVETSFLLDTTPPAPPTIDGPIEEDAVVNIAESPDVLISGTGEPEATVEVTIDDGNPLTDPIVVTLPIDEEGNWSMTGAEVDVNSLEDGTLTITAIVTDQAGNQSEPTSIQIEKDTVAPDAPADPNMSDETDQGEVIDDEVTNANTPIFDAPAGTGIPGDIVTLYIDGNPVSTAIVNEDGSYQVTPELPIEDGEHVVTLTFTDPAGNEGQPSSELPIVIDSIAPSGLTLTAPIEVDDVTNIAESPTVDFSGDGVEPSSIVEVTLTDSALNTLGPITATVNPDGTWELPGVDITSLVDGEITVSVVETDLAGNLSEPVTTVIEKDTVAPDDVANSLSPDLDVGSDSGPADDDDVTFNNVPTFTAGPESANAGDTVTVYIDGESAGTAKVNSDGSFSVTIDEVLEDGEYEVTLTFSDPAGNESVPTAVLPITIDTTPPNSDDIQLTDAGPEFVEGTGEPGATIHLLDDEGHPITDSAGNPVVALVDEDGNWSIEDVSPKFLNGDTVTVVITDPAGNVSTAELKVEYFGFDSFNNLSAKQGTFDDISTVNANGFFNTRREILFSSMIKNLGSQPIVSGIAVPGSVLIGRVYGHDGSVLGEAQITADAAGNWLMNFGNTIDNDAPTIIIEHIATEAVPVGASRFDLSSTTYTQFGFGANPSRQSSSPGAISSLPGTQLRADHQQNLNPLSVL